MHERRVIFTADARLTVTPADATKRARLTGYPLVWNSLSDDRGGFKIRLAPGSAKFKTPTRALYEHRNGDPLGTTENGSARFTCDEVGAKVEIDLPNTTLARDTMALVENGYVRGMSFGMASAPWAVRGYSATGQPNIVGLPGKSIVTVENGQKILTCLAYEVDEVSVTGNPSFADTSVNVTRYSRNCIVLARTMQANQLQRFKFDLLALSGAV